MAFNRKECAGRLFVPLYQERFIETLRNTDNLKKQQQGWTLKNGSWALWFFNMRTVGDAKGLFPEVCTAMAEMIIEDNKVDVLIGVELAGLILVGGVAMAMKQLGHPVRIGYTRPLPTKVRNPQELIKEIHRIDQSVADYGEKQYVEARFRDGDRVGIVDDMATDIGSKIIARKIVLWQAALLGLRVECNDLYYILNRTKGNKEKAFRFVITEKERELVPEPLYANYIVEFDDCFPQLQAHMLPEEYKSVQLYQGNPALFQDKQVQAEWLAKGAKWRLT
jgi:orotate phosphoribosyltransferase